MVLTFPDSSTYDIALRTCLTLYRTNNSLKIQLLLADLNMFS